MQRSLLLPSCNRDRGWHRSSLFFLLHSPRGALQVRMLLVPGHCLLVGVRDLADRRLVERLTRNLQPDRQPVGIETAWHLDRWKSGKIENRRVNREVLGH